MKTEDVVASSAGYLDEFMWMGRMLGERNAFDNNIHTAWGGYICTILIILITVLIVLIYLVLKGF